MGLTKSGMTSLLSSAQKNGPNRYFRQRGNSMPSIGKEITNLSVSAHEYNMQRISGSLSALCSESRLPHPSSTEPSLLQLSPQSLKWKNPAIGVRALFCSKNNERTTRLSFTTRVKRGLSEGVHSSSTWINQDDLVLSYSPSHCAAVRYFPYT